MLFHWCGFRNVARKVSCTRGTLLPLRKSILYAMLDVTTFNGQNRWLTVSTAVTATLYVVSLVFRPQLYPDPERTYVGVFLFAPVHGNGPLATLTYFLKILGISGLMGAVTYFAILMNFGDWRRPHFAMQRNISILFMIVFNIIIIMYAR